MAYVSTAAAAIAAAATQLEGLRNSFAAESAAAATPTTAIAPAASDEVSPIQSGVFSTYGQLYQTVSAEAQASTTPINSFITSLTGFLENGFGTGTGGLSSNLLQVPLNEMGNFASSQSDLIGMGGGGLMTALAGPSTMSADIGGLGSALASDVGPAGAAGLGGAGGIGAAPVLAAVANGGRGGSSFGAPRYGVKPKFTPAIPKPTIT